MGGEGSMAGAILSLKNNRKLLKKRNVRELKDLLRSQSGKTELEFKKISPHELLQVKKAIRSQTKKDAQRLIFIYVFSLLLSIGMIYFIYWFVT
jgi:hypothetical protein